MFLKLHLEHDIFYGTWHRFSSANSAYLHGLQSTPTVNNQLVGGQHGSLSLFNGNINAAAVAAAHSGSFTGSLSGIIGHTTAIGISHTGSSSLQNQTYPGLSGHNAGVTHTGSMSLFQQALTASHNGSLSIYNQPPPLGSSGFSGNGNTPRKLSLGQYNQSPPASASAITSNGYPNGINNGYHNTQVSQVSNGSSSNLIGVFAGTPHATVLSDSTEGYTFYDASASASNRRIGADGLFTTNRVMITEGMQLYSDALYRPMCWFIYLLV